MAPFCRVQAHKKASAKVLLEVDSNETIFLIFTRNMYKIVE